MYHHTVVWLKAIAALRALVHEQQPHLQHAFAGGVVEALGCKCEVNLALVARHTDVRSQMKMLTCRCGHIAYASARQDREGWYKLPQKWPVCTPGTSLQRICMGRRTHIGKHRHQEPVAPTWAAAVLKVNGYPGTDHFRQAHRQDGTPTRTRSS
eukprot:COSAG05_NODE_1164_length_5652_cov_6.810733_1_plen_154_part_00